MYTPEVMTYSLHVSQRNANFLGKVMLLSGVSDAVFAATDAMEYSIRDLVNGIPPNSMLTTTARDIFLFFTPTVTTRCGDAIQHQASCVMQDA